MGHKGSKLSQENIRELQQSTYCKLQCFPFYFDLTVIRSDKLTASIDFDTAVSNFPF